MSEPRIATRLFVDQPLGEGQTVGLDHQQAHFLRSVLRLSTGAELALFNGRDGEWRARVDALGKGWASLAVVERRRAQQAEPDLWLVFAPIKRARLDFMVEKACELGASRLLPVFTQNTDVSRVNCERLRANCREAAEQSERLTVPEVAEPTRLRDLLDAWPAERHLLLGAESGAAPPVAEELARARERAGGRAAVPASQAPWAVLVGPEGGFTEAELDALTKLPFVTAAGLGPRVLRADTAAIALLACWQAWLGDGDARPPLRS
ncbi:MAG: 16S rRNA (uracil(1498)-N(3))-methyltransferase [Rhodovibrio sp.]|nr:16S rRNA (uracil(1498)-N(3))-methyltransferase [Rhodovibrio sp.]